MVKIKLKDFLKFVNFRDCLDENGIKETTKIIRIYYPDLSNEDKFGFKNDRYFEYGVYDFSYDTINRIKETINPAILELYVIEVGIVDDESILKICVDFENYIDYHNAEYECDRDDNFKNGGIKKIFVSSPLAGDYEENIKKVKAYCRWVVLQGNIPLAPHAYYTGFLKEESKEERQLGMDMGLHWLAESDEIWVFNHYGISQGMQVEIDMAKRLSIPIKYFDYSIEDFKKEQNLTGEI